MSKWIVEMPDDWDGTCETCPHTEIAPYTDYAEKVYNCQADCEMCPLISAKKAIMLDGRERALYICDDGKDPVTYMGKPVKLWATEEE